MCKRTLCEYIIMQEGKYIYALICKRMQLQNSVVDEYIIISTCHHYHHVVSLARISLTLSRHFSQSLIASDRSSGLHPVSSQSCCMYVRAGRPAFARPYAGVHRSTSLMSSSLLLQQCPAYLVCLTWIVFVMGGRWLYSCCLVGCCHQDLFNIANKWARLKTWRNGMLDFHYREIKSKSLIAERIFIH